MDSGLLAADLPRTLDQLDEFLAVAFLVVAAGGAGTDGAGSVGADEEFHAETGRYRDAEQDAMHVDESEKIYDDDDMWKVYESGE